MTNYKDWKTAISVGDTSFEALKRLTDCDVDAIEISRGWREYHLIDWQEAKANADKANVEIWSFHLPFANEIDIAHLDEDERLSAVNIHKNLIKKASAVGVKVFVVHPSAEPIADENRPQSLENAKRSLAALAEHADKFGATICVEDLPRTCLGHDAKEIKELISADERLRVCFDVNHLCMEYGCTHKDFVEMLGDKIVTTHMSDYDFIDEKHLFPGIGKINWKELVELLEGVDYCGPFLYEGGFSPSGWSPELPYGKIEDAKDRHMNIKQFTGE